MPLPYQNRSKTSKVLLGGVTFSTPQFSVGAQTGKQRTDFEPHMKSVHNSKLSILAFIEWRLMTRFGPRDIWSKSMTQEEASG